MLFNSLAFLLFFPIVALLYWVLPARWRNPMLLAASYYFYMNWEPIYALLILFSSVTTWFAGLLLERKKEKRRAILTATIVVNIAILFVYKYMGFVTTTVHEGLAALGIAIDIPSFTLLLPVGISFYTFQAVGYIVDVYRRTITAERNLMTYALFVAFFPQLVAGPIERAANLLPQFKERHYFNGTNMIKGLNMMAWGYFMKLCIAENVAPYVNAVYNNIGMHNGKSIWLATFFFTFQIFCDFGGYSLIAIGTARCIGFNLMQNFKQPYLARNVREFWHRWHISLSSWLTDYIYIPLGGSRCSEAKHHRNLIATFMISGLWHGANWTFVLWGTYHGILQSTHALKRKYLNFKFPWHRLGVILAIISTFLLSMIGWVLFRANSVSDAKIALTQMMTPTSQMLFNGDGKPDIVLPIILILLLMLREVREELGLKIRFTSHSNIYVSALSMTILIAIILLCARFESGQFIYFQF